MTASDGTAAPDGVVTPEGSTNVAKSNAPDRIAALDERPYDRIAFKASHNSIDRRPSITDQLSGAAGLVEPCRGLELDLVQDGRSFAWRVQHGLREDGPELGSVLDEIRSWSDRPENRRHPVVTLHLDLKNAHFTHESFAEVLDALLEERLGAGRIYRPGDVVGDRPDLVRGARAGGWALFSRLRGRFVVCLTGHGERKRRYARHRPRARLCFADYPGSRGAPRKGHRIFANLFVDADGYRENLARVRRHPGFVARAYNIVHRRTWALSVEGGANLLSGDVLDSRSLSLGGRGMAPVAR